MVHQFDQTTIETLLQERLSAGSKGRYTTGDGDGSGIGAKDGSGNLSGDPTYLSSLQEQCATLKELLHKCAEERDKYKLELARLRPSTEVQTACTGKGSGSASVREFAASSTQGDRTLQDYVNQLEAELRRQSEAMSKVVSPRRLYRHVWEATDGESDAQLQKIQLPESELEALRQGKNGGGGDALRSVVDAPESVAHKRTEPSCDSPGPLALGKTAGDKNDTACLSPCPTRLRTSSSDWKKLRLRIMHGKRR
ncbi:uncharacterized protein Tco025E_06335 [Trypanosoma conorhini]|uniref:Uncharacterized protein n=1 Tax=Trypanosoma conorhini TaxID=83891 RepID=A0A3R7KT59_9TRYP|nr:uncharacterized protein Tco025E_06335 [Trypanosoma conorhini]RNF13012.1 hypothetical protein Tco025E_06335 [Trypanosoma conorhini]